MCRAKSCILADRLVEIGTVSLHELHPLWPKYWVFWKLVHRNPFSVRAVLTTLRSRCTSYTISSAMTAEPEEPEYPSWINLAYFDICLCYGFVQTTWRHITLITWLLTARSFGYFQLQIQRVLIEKNYSQSFFFIFFNSWFLLYMCWSSKIWKTIFLCVICTLKDLPVLDICVPDELFYSPLTEWVFTKLANVAQPCGSAVV